SKPNRTVADMRQGIDENQTQIIPGGNNRSPTQLGNSKPRESTISPSIQSGSHKVPHRSGLGHVPSKVRAIIREVRTQKRSRRSSNFSTIMILGLLGMIGLVFLFGGDKFVNRVKKDSSKVTAQFDLNKKKKIGKETREELPNLATNNDPALKPRPSPEPIAPVVDSQTVIIDPVSTRIVEKESPSPRTSRVPNTVSKPLLGINRTKIPNQTPITAPNSDTNAKPKVSTLGEKPSQETRAPILASLPEKSSTQTDKIAPELPPNRDPGLLKVTALPAAEIYLNGKLFGTTNDRELNGIKLDPGSYTLRLKRKGYKTDEQQVQIKAGEQRALNVTLLKSVDLIALNIRCNRTPALLVIEDLLAGRRKEVSITKHNFSMNLRPGSYRVNVSFGDEVINRTVELSENEPSITFNAEFK
ncbi:MAG: PEGA domain-containing protein, partial [Proteobacteria bacterium]|nr:PEGA domain-containing protein [Pseudomonadota bacterium]